MKNISSTSMSFTALVGLVVLPASLFAATGEVTKSGSTWTGRVDGVTRYTGAQMTNAVNACANNMSSGGINIRAGGNASADYGIRGKSNVSMFFFNNSFNGNGSISLMTVDNKANITVDNLRITNNPRYAVWFRSSRNIYLWQHVYNQTGGLGIRVDNSKGAAGGFTNLYSPSVSGATAQAVETYGIAGVSWGTVTARNSTGCGLLLNQSTNNQGGTVDAYNCNYGGGYAGYRNANNNGYGTLGYAHSNHCGRGYFSVSGSRDMTVNNCLLENNSGIGIWLQTTYNTRVRAGTVRNNAGGCFAIGGGSGNSVTVKCQ